MRDLYTRLYYRHNATCTLLLPRSLGSDACIIIYIVHYGVKRAFYVCMRVYVASIFPRSFSPRGAVGHDGLRPGRARTTRTETNKFTRPPASVLHIVRRGRRRATPPSIRKKD